MGPPWRTTLGAGFGEHVGSLWVPAGLRDPSGIRPQAVGVPVSTPVARVLPLALVHAECQRWSWCSGTVGNPLKPHPEALMNLQPLEDRLVVRPAEAEETTASGLVIPDTAKEKPQQGEVLAVGPGRRSDSGDLIPVDVAVGDKVVYSKYGGTEITIEGEDLLILQARDVLAIVK
jgi:chaperonin GroES